MRNKIDRTANAIEHEKREKHRQELKRFKEQIQQIVDEVLDEMELEVEG